MNHSPLTPAFGALVEDLPLADLQPAQLRQLYELWQRCHLLLLRGGTGSRDAFEGFASRLGEIDALADQSVGETAWGAELPAVRRPPFACMLRAIEAPVHGGAMWFASLPAALRSIAPDLVARLRWLSIAHGDTHHPLVVMHPETGEPSLFLGERAGARIVGLDPAESERLLNILWSYATATSVTLVHRWQPGDVVLWNNLTVMHRHEPLPPGIVRRLQHVRFKGRYTLSAPIQTEAA